MAGLSFPTRFFRKLEIFQQIQKNQGLAKHKKLWEQEVVFLKWAFGEEHQHLNNFKSSKKVKEIIKTGIGKEPDKIEETIGNLYFKGFVDLKDTSDNLNPPKAGTETRFIGKYSLRPTMLGLEFGEVLTEVGDNSLYLNKYFVSIGMIWLSLFFSFLLLSIELVNRMWPIVKKIFC